MHLIKHADKKQQQKVQKKGQELRFEFQGHIIWFNLFKLNLKPIFELIQSTFHLHTHGLSKPLKSA